MIPLQEPTQTSPSEGREDGSPDEDGGVNEGRGDVMRWSEAAGKQAARLLMSSKLKKDTLVFLRCIFDPRFGLMAPAGTG